MAEPGSAALDRLGRAGRGRLAPPAGGQRAVQQAVLRCFAAVGRPPTVAALDGVTGGADPRVVLAALRAADFLGLDADGQIQAAYPFSAVPTRHQVQIAGGAVVYAMCAIDALGIAPMLAAPVTISSTDPATGQAITVTVSAAGGGVWDPPSAVVFAGCRVCGGEMQAAAKEICGVVNFFARNASAAAWAARHPGVTGTILGQDEAERLATQIFGPLLGGRVTRGGGR